MAGIFAKLRWWSSIDCDRHISRRECKKNLQALHQNYLMTELSINLVTLNKKVLSFIFVIWFWKPDFFIFKAPTQSLFFVPTFKSHLQKFIFLYFLTLIFFRPWPSPKFLGPRLSLIFIQPSVAFKFFFQNILSVCLMYFKTWAPTDF